jgi:uncharacterized protein
MARIVHFEIPADDPERAVAFYEKALGWKIEKWEGPMDYWLVTTGREEEPGINGGIYRKGDFAATVNTVGVDSIDAAVQRVLESGGTLVRPKHAIPGMGWLVYCADTEGNLFGMMQPDMSAK